MLLTLLKSGHVIPNATSEVIMMSTLVVSSHKLGDGSISISTSVSNMANLAIKERRGGGGEPAAKLPPEGGKTGGSHGHPQMRWLATARGARTAHHAAIVRKIQVKPMGMAPSP